MRPWNYSCHRLALVATQSTCWAPHLCHQAGERLKAQLLNQPDEARLLAVTARAVVPARVCGARQVAGRYVVGLFRVSWASVRNACLHVLLVTQSTACTRSHPLAPTAWGVWLQPSKIAAPHART